MLKLTIEEKLGGPLMRPVVLCALEALVAYKGGNYVAVHRRVRRRKPGESLIPSADMMGVTRLAIITEEAQT